MPSAHTSWNGWRRSRHWSINAIDMTRARIAVRAGRVTDIGGTSFGSANSGALSGGDQLVVVAMQAVAQPVTERCALRPGDGYRAHDLANFALAAEQVAPRPHPRSDVAPVAMELERARVDRRPLRPRDGRLGRDHVEDVHAPRRAVDHLQAAVAPDRDVVLDDRRHVDAEVVERAHRGRW